MSHSNPSAGAVRKSATLDHVADFYNRHPGEIVVLHTRITVAEPRSGLTLRVSLPQGMELVSYQAPPALPLQAPFVEVDPRSQSHALAWHIDEELVAGAPYDYQAQARVMPTPHDGELESRAVLTDEQSAVLAEETVAVKISATGKYLQYLPEVYAQDELMGRFLMLFESFWAPIESQIRNIDCYFDPQITPLRMIPWLASWLDARLDEHMTEASRRRLLLAAVPLYRRRGTRRGLQEYLEIYTGGTARIVEHHAHNFRLGPEARLGPNIALGRDNVPCTFTVILQLPPLPEDQAADEHARRRSIEALIEAEKPAHTACTLQVETLDTK